MKRMRYELSKVAWSCCFASLLTACGAPEVCRSSSTASFTTVRSSDRFTLTSAGETVVRAYTAGLEGLSRIWPAERPLFLGQLSLRLSLAYAENVGVGGAVQMPQVSVRFEPSAANHFANFTTSSFPPTAGVVTGLSLFPICTHEDQTECCQHGQTYCRVSGQVRFERLDGEPFPPVVLDLETWASATVSDCPPAPDPGTELDFELSGAP